MNDYPVMAAEAGRVEPAPRRVRGYLAGSLVFDTTAAHYVWEWPYYPQYYVPLADVAPEALAGLRRTGAARVHADDAAPGIAGTVRFEWDSLDSWFEEEEQIFVHPRNPYVRVDAIRSRRHLRVELDGVLLAESRAPVLLFETGLPTRYYVERAEVDFAHLVPASTQSRCPYKGTTTDYWSVQVGDDLHEDLAWGYDFPTAAVLPVAGMIAFYNEKVDITLDGVRLERPTTKFS